MSKDAHIDHLDMTEFAGEIAAALDRAIGNTNVAIKTVTGWTGANERTVKNWFAGRYAPNGYHLVTLARHCDEVMVTFLMLADRRDLLSAQKLSYSRQELLAALTMLATVLRESELEGA